MQARGVTTRFCLRALVFAFPLMLVAKSDAQQVTLQLEIEETGEVNEAYLDSVSGKGLQTDIVYLKPHARYKPDESAPIKVPERPEDRQSSASSNRLTWGIVFGAIVAIVLWIVVTQGGAIGVSFGSTSGREARRDGAPDGPTDDELEAINRQPLDQFLVSLRDMADRRQALILLVSRALERSADANKVRLGRAQTARDVLRILPRNWTHLQALRDLVREAEVVHFGGRDLSEERWQECYASAEPIFRRGRFA